MKNKRNFSRRRYATVRLTTDAVLIAVYVALASFVSINLGNVIISLSSLPILLCVFVFGVPDAVAVALCGCTDFPRQRRCGWRRPWRWH